MVATPEGKLARYFYGIEYSPRDLRLGLVEASQNKIGSPVDQLAALLLPLRSGYRKIWRRSNEHGSCGWRGHTLRHGGAVFRNAPPQRDAGAFTCGRGRLAMQTPWIPFIPPSASTLSGKVDALYFYLAGVTLFFTLLISGVLDLFRNQVSSPQPYEIPRPVAGSHKLETIWSVIPFIIAHDHVCLGRSSLSSSNVRPPTECDGDLRRGQTVDVENSAHDRPARDQ